MTEPPVDRAARIYIDIIGDLFHPGHLRHLDKAKSLGGRLVVGVFDDATAERLSHIPVNTLDERVAIISALRSVDEVVPGAPAAPDPDFLDRYNIDNICLSDDFDDTERQQAMAALLDEGSGIVLPYTEDLTTAEIVSRVAGSDIGPPSPQPDRKAIVHAATPSSRASDPAILDALGAIAAGIFGRNWMLERARLGDQTWSALLKCMANNQVERNTRRPVDPRFLAAIVSLAGRHRVKGDRINLIGNAADMAGPVLADRGMKVTILRPGIAQPSGPAKTDMAGCDCVYCDVAALPDACPPAELTAVLDAPWSALLMVDAPLLFESVRRLTRDLILAIDFWPEDSGSFLPVDRGGTFHFSDTFVRNILHDQGFFDVEDILTTCNGAPLPEGTDGCSRLSRTAMVEQDRSDGGFRYLDGDEAKAAGKAESGKYLRWYRASKIAIATDAQ